MLKSHDNRGKGDKYSHSYTKRWKKQGSYNFTDYHEISSQLGIDHSQKRWKLVLMPRREISNTELSKPSSQAWPALFSSVRQVSILLLQGVFRWHNAVLQPLIISKSSWRTFVGPGWKQKGAPDWWVPSAPGRTAVTLLPFWKKQLKHIQEKYSVFKMTRRILVHVLTACKAEDILLLFYILLYSHNHAVSYSGSWAPALPFSLLRGLWCRVYHPEHPSPDAKSPSH